MHPVSVFYFGVADSITAAYSLSRVTLSSLRLTRYSSVSFLSLFLYLAAVVFSVVAILLSWVSFSYLQNKLVALQPRNKAQERKPIRDMVQLNTRSANFENV